MPNALVISPTQLDQIVIRSSQIKKNLKKPMYKLSMTQNFNPI